MRITPLDVRKQEFGKGMRGYDCDEVRAFLNTLSDEYETVLVDNKNLRETIMSQDAKLSEFHNIEQTLRDTLMTAQKAMEETRENARREGDLIVRGAQQESRGILEECRRRTEELRREIMMLRKEKESYLVRFRTLAQAQIQFVDSHESDFEDLDKRLGQMVDTVVVGLEHTTGEKPATVQAPAGVGDPEPGETTDSGRQNSTSEVDVWRDYQPTTEEVEAARAEESKPGQEAAEEIVQTITSLEGEEGGEEATVEVEPEVTAKV